MNYILIGKIVNTHGIKGELRILSDFEMKEKVFKNNFNIYIGPNYIKETINTYRVHKNFDMITLNNYSNINEVLKYKGLNVYINKDDLNLKDNEYLYSDLIDFTIKDNNEYLGKVKSYILNGNNVLLYIDYDKDYYIPLVDEYIISVDLNNKIINCQNIRGLIL